MLSSLNNLKIESSRTLKKPALCRFFLQLSNSSPSNNNRNSHHRHKKLETVSIEEISKYLSHKVDYELPYEENIAIESWQRSFGFKTSQRVVSQSIVVKISRQRKSRVKNQQNIFARFVIWVFSPGIRWIGSKMNSPGLMSRFGRCIRRA